MNIFVLDISPVVSARYHADAHVVKMITESAQMLSTAHHVFGTHLPCMYKAAYTNHPCSVWARASHLNYRWLYALFYALVQEYQYRYRRPHNATVALTRALYPIPRGIPLTSNRTPFALAMPCTYKGENPVDSYRRYYANQKTHLAVKYTRRHRPRWLLEYIEEPMREEKTNYLKRRI